MWQIQENQKLLIMKPIRDIKDIENLKTDEK